MSDSPVPPVRPVSLFTILVLFGAFAAFLVVVHSFYAPAPLAADQAAPDNLPKDLAWRATAETRRKALGELQEREKKQASTYAWIDRQAGVVQLPIERAMELTVSHYRSKQ